MSHSEHVAAWSDTKANQADSSQNSIRMTRPLRAIRNRGSEINLEICLALSRAIPLTWTKELSEGGVADIGVDITVGGTAYLHPVKNIKIIHPNLGKDLFAE